MCDWKFSTDCGLRGIRRRLGLPARRRELGCRLLFWRCPSHFVESPWKREDRHCSSSSSAIGPGDFLRSETCPPQPGSSDPSRDALVTVMWEIKERNVLPLLTKIRNVLIVNTAESSMDTTRTWELNRASKWAKTESIKQKVELHKSCPHVWMCAMQNKWIKVLAGGIRR